MSGNFSRHFLLFSQIVYSIYLHIFPYRMNFILNYRLKIILLQKNFHKFPFLFLYIIFHLFPFSLNYIQNSCHFFHFLVDIM